MALIPHTDPNSEDTGQCSIPHVNPQSPKVEGARMTKEWKDIASYVVDLEQEAIRLRDLLREILEEFDNVYDVDIDERGVGHANIGYALARLISEDVRAVLAKTEAA